MSAYTTSNSPYTYTVNTSPMSQTATLQPMNSVTSFQTSSTVFTTSAPVPSKKRMSFFKKDKDASSNANLLQPLAETKEEKKLRKQREEEAKMSPEELKLAQLMGRYGPSGGSFGGMSMDYKTKDSMKSQQRR